ncbi:hypothetical protein LRZ95_01855, partial [Candidatus Gracilibacteria bacterium]|nr:hypothetical protein [Candidatus Gracilibacteria bacterium]
DINLTTDDLKKISSGDMSPINYQIKAAGEGFKENLKDDIGETIENIGGGIENTINKFNGDKQNLENTIDEIGFNNKKITRNDLLIILANRIGVNVKQLEKVLNNGKNELVSNLEFKKLINKALASKSVSSNPKMEGIIDLWDKVNKMTYSKENKIIKELQDNNREKFDTLKDIINTEIVRNKELKKKLNNIGVNKLVTKVGYTSDNKIDLYNKSLSKYNDKFKKSAEKLFTYKDTKKQELDQMKDDLMSKIKTPLKNYSTGINKRTNEKLLTKVSSRNTLLSATTAVNSDTVTVNSCQAQQDSDYKRTYKGIYVVENDKSYRLFDYLGELQGDEIIKMYDMDGDNDDDVLYFVNKQLYLKENLENKSTKIYVSENPIVVNIDDNKFYNGDVFYESINNAHEIGDDHGNINIGFTAPTNINLNKFRLGFYDRVDKYINEDNNSYRPKFIKKDIVDAISDKDNITKIEETNLYKRSNNLVYIKNIGDLSGVKLKTKEIKDISTRLNSGIVVNIRKGKKIYAGKNSFTITYINEESENKLEQKISIPAYTNIEFKSNIKIIGIEGNGYVMGYTEIVYKGTDIRKLLNKPLSMGTTISYVGSNYETKDISYIDLEYYDGSELGLDFNKVKKWELFDLGLKTKDYSIRLSRENDYYYAKIYAFKNNINSTLSKQILFAPQKESDINPPELSLKNIKIPVYQKHITDLTNEIYEDSGMSGIKKIVVDFDLTKDSDGDGNKKNDDDLNLDGEYKNQINILKNPAYIKFEFKSFNKIFKKKIGISITDANNNVGYSEILLDVYSPIPTITSYANGLINGKLKEEYLTDEPINLYRFRGGVITRLETKDNKKISYTKSGYYSFDVKTSGTGLKLFDSENKQIAFINEKTGKIFIKDNSITTDVLSSSNIKNDSVFPKIILKKNNLEIFYQYLRLKDISKVRFVNNFEEVNGRGIYFKFTDLNHYSYYTIPEGLD